VKRDIKLRGKGCAFKSGMKVESEADEQGRQGMMLSIIVEAK